MTLTANERMLRGTVHVRVGLHLRTHAPLRELLQTNFYTHGDACCNVLETTIAATLPGCSVELVREFVRTQRVRMGGATCRCVGCMGSCHRFYMHMMQMVPKGHPMMHDPRAYQGTLAPSRLALHSSRVGTPRQRPPAIPRVLLAHVSRASVRFSRSWRGLQPRCSQCTAVAAGASAATIDSHPVTRGAGPSAGRELDQMPPAAVRVGTR